MRGNARSIPPCMRFSEIPLSLPSGCLEPLVALMTAAGAAKPELPARRLEALAIQTWRLGRRVEALSGDDATRGKRQLQDSHKRLSDLLHECGVLIEDPIGTAYTDGWLEVDVIAWEDPEGPAPAGVHGPWVKQTIKPVIRFDGRLLARGEIVVADPGKGTGATPVARETRK